MGANFAPEPGGVLGVGRDRERADPMVPQPGEAVAAVPKADFTCDKPKVRHLNGIGAFSNPSAEFHVSRPVDLLTAGSSDTDIAARMSPDTVEPGQVNPDDRVAGIPLWLPT